MFHMQRGRNKVFDDLNDRILAAEVMQAQTQCVNETK